MSNFRPASVLNVFSNIYEWVIKDQIVGDMEKKCLPFLSAYRSSNINEVIRLVLNFYFFFYDKISQVQKSTKRIQGTKKH